MPKPFHFHVLQLLLVDRATCINLEFRYLHVHRTITVGRCVMILIIEVRYRSASKVQPIKSSFTAREMCTFCVASDHCGTWTTYAEHVTQQRFLLRIILALLEPIHNHIAVRMGKLLLILPSLNTLLLSLFSPA